MQDAACLGRRHVHDVAGVRHRQHALPHQLEALRRPLRACERDGGVEQAADAGVPHRCSRRNGHPRRCDPGSGDDARPLAGKPLRARPQQRRRPRSGHLPRHDRGGLQVHRDRRRLDRAACGTRARQHALRQRARLRVHLLRRTEHAVPELVCARLSADRRPLRRHELLRPGAVRPRGGRGSPRRKSRRDHGTARSVFDEERDDQSDDGARDGLRLPVGRCHRDLQRSEAEGRGAPGAD